MSSALVLFSGGQDSTTCLLWAIKKFGIKNVQTVFFDYGQTHKIEWQCAYLIAEKLGVKIKKVEVNSLKQLSKNALTDKTIKAEDNGGLHNLPSSFVPGRNALFLILAASYAATLNIDNIVIGASQADYSGYPDCRQEFISSIEKSLSLALAINLKIHTPLMNLDKADVFKLAYDLGGAEMVVNETHTCYLGVREKLNVWGFGCGECPACLLRKNGFKRYNYEYIMKENNNASC